MISGLCACVEMKVLIGRALVPGGWPAGLRHLFTISGVSRDSQ